jgi:UDP-N-acetylglucosamine:LPS N-acetylglucosamine transferase
MTNPKVIIFYTKIGGGHLSTAKTILKSLRNNPKFVDSAVKLVNITDVHNQNKSNFWENIYKILLARLPAVWSFLILIWKVPAFAWIFRRTFEVLYTNNLKAILNEFEPDVVVSTYYFASEICQKLGHKRTFTVVPDIFSCHPIWFDSKSNNQYLVFSEQAKQIAINHKVKNVQNMDLVFDPKFETKMTQEETTKFKQNNGFDPNKKLILALGGGSGFPKAKQFLEEYLNSSLKAELVIVCGRDKNLKKQLEKLYFKHHNSHKNVKILEFTDQVYEYMNSCDLIVTKSGPATILEAVTLAKPLFLIHYIWEQELGNMQWVVDNNLGIYEPNPKQLISKIEQYLAGELCFQTVQNHNNLDKLADVVLE